MTDPLRIPREDRAVASPSGPTLRDVTGLVDAELDQVHQRILKDLRPEEPALAELVELAAGYRGKQLRPAMVLLAGKAVGEIRQEHVLVGEIIELLHTATLVHDDVLDGASMRRGQATLNALHGADVPVLLGDYIYAKAFHLSVMLEDPTCSRVLAETTRKICQGEITQIQHRFDFEWNEERYDRVITAKTALLYANACSLGAHYAHGTEEQVEAMDRFGLQVGVAFQIVDDCLDLAGDESVVGKSLGTDLETGKLTLPLLRLMNGPGARQRLESLMRSDSSSIDKLQRLRVEFPLEDALKQSYAVARQRLADARSALSMFAPSDSRDALEALTTYIETRAR
ncbi:MAG: polyprenyl synthetase family protein [Planctomycetota bacterium]